MSTTTKHDRAQLPARVPVLAVWLAAVLLAPGEPAPEARRLAGVLAMDGDRVQ